MMWRRPQSPPDRARLIERKHAIEGELNGLRADRRRLARRGEPTAMIDARIADLANQHYEMRIEIDRAGPGPSHG